MRIRDFDELAPGTLVTVTKPEHSDSYPGWNEEMNVYDGTAMHFARVVRRDAGNLVKLAEYGTDDELHWVFNPEWLELYDVDNTGDAMERLV